MKFVRKSAAAHTTNSKLRVLLEMQLHFSELKAEESRLPFVVNTPCSENDNSPDS